MIKIFRGYIRVSTRGQAKNTSLKDQHRKLKAEGCQVIYRDIMSGATMKRPGFAKMCKESKAGDTLVFTSLDRFARTETEAYTMILEWVRTDIKVRVLNIGTIEDTEVGRLILHIMLAFSEFERDIIIARTQNARSLKRAQDPLYKEGRPLKFSKERLDHAMELLKTHTYKETAELTGVSKSTIWREAQRLNFYKRLDLD